MELFKSNYTKWVPVTYYYHSFSMFLLMARKNKKTGFIRFKSSPLNKDLNTQMRSEELLNMYDASEQLSKLTQ